MKKYLIYKELCNVTDGCLQVAERELTGDVFSNKMAAEKCCKLLNEVENTTNYKFLEIKFEKEYDSISQFKSENHDRLIKMKIDYILNRKQYTIDLLSWDKDVYKRRPVKMHLDNLVSAANELKFGVEFSTDMYGYDDVEFKKYDLPKIKEIIKGAFDEVDKLKSKLKGRQTQEKQVEQKIESKQNKEREQ